MSRASRNPALADHVSQQKKLGPRLRGGDGWGDTIRRGARCLTAPPARSSGGEAPLALHVERLPHPVQPFIFALFLQAAGEEKASVLLPTCLPFAVEKQRQRLLPALSL